MRKMMIACAVGMALQASAVQADWPAGQSHFKTMMRYLGDNTAFSAYWIDALPRIAGACDMKVVKSQLYNVLGNFKDESGIMFYLDRISAGKMENEMMTEWNGFDDSGHSIGCATADRLWGEDGDMYPGVLRKL